MAEKSAECMGLPRVTLQPVLGGAANLAYLVYEGSDTAGKPSAFLRRRGAGALADTDYTLAREGELLKAAKSLGFPVADVLGAFDNALLMKLVPGTSQLTPEIIDAVGKEYMALVAKLHQTELSHFPVKTFTTVTEAVRYDLDWWYSLAREQDVADTPLISGGYRILSSTLPQSEEKPVLVHGDVGAGNFMVEGSRVSAMLDWELAHAGDPHEDLAWLWMRGAHSDFGDPLQRIGEYRDVRKVPIANNRLRWHLGFVMWKSCLSMETAMHNFAATNMTLLQSVVQLTYEALLGSQLVQIMGGSMQLLEQTPIKAENLVSRLAERLLQTPDLPREHELISSYIQAMACQQNWEQEQLCRDIQLFFNTSDCNFHKTIHTLDRTHLQSLAMVLARQADRVALAQPKAVRRIQRAQAIGLGTEQQPQLEESP